MENLLDSEHGVRTNKTFIINSPTRMAIKLGIRYPQFSDAPVLCHMVQTWSRTSETVGGTIRHTDHGHHQFKANL